LPRAPESKAGANDLAGFIDAPEMNARKNMSRQRYYQRTHKWEDNDSEIETDRDTGSP
jgi:hypothetical protein